MNSIWLSDVAETPQFSSGREGLTMYRYIGLALVMVWVYAPTAFADEERASIAMAPLELRRKPEAIQKISELVEEYERLVRATGAQVPPPAETKAALDALKRQDWASSNEALGQLAHSMKTTYGIYLQVDYPVTGTVVGLGKVVSSNGVLIGKEVQLERSREMQTYAQATEALMALVIARLELENLPVSLPVAPVVVKPDAPDVPLIAPLPIPAPMAMIEVTSTSRVASYVIAGVGAVGVVVGSALLMVADSDAAQIKTNASGIAIGAANDATATLSEGVVSKRTAGRAVIGIGAASLVAAMVVYLVCPATQRSEAAPAVSLAPMRDGALLQVEWELP